uniref:AN1-type domain-containing protein n=1 Tax=Solanum lycopersicum TaxID=4081 RepID=A0A3Q7EZ03_SOLLC
MTSCDKTENPTLCSRNCGSCANSRNHDAYEKIYLFHKMFSLTIRTGKDDPMIKTKPQRCMICRKKVGLIGFNCKCDEVFCEIHRYPEEHACTYNFKSKGRAILAKENPPCKTDKLKNRI